VLQCAAVEPSFVDLGASSLQRGVVCCRILQCGVIRSSVFEFISFCCSVLQSVGKTTVLQAGQRCAAGKTFFMFHKKSGLRRILFIFFCLNWDTFDLKFLVLFTNLLVVKMIRTLNTE